jgi:hypothetical protein
VGKKKRGRPDIGPRVCFRCSDELYDYVYWFGKEQGADDWSDALRRLIIEHRRFVGTRKAPITPEKTLIN